MSNIKFMSTFTEEVLYMVAAQVRIPKYGF